jgi:hypothetical protein
MKASVGPFVRVRYDYTQRRPQEADLIPTWLSPVIAKVALKPGLGRFFARNTMSASGSDGITCRTSQGFWTVAGFALQVPISETRGHQMGTVHVGGSAALDLYDGGAVPGSLGTQHPGRRGKALLDHVPDDGR